MIKEKKGILLATYNNNAYFCKSMTDEFTKYINLIQKEGIIDDETKKYIKENNTKYIIIGTPKEIIPDLGIPIISIMGDPPRALTNTDYAKFLQKCNVKGIITHDQCTLDCVKDFFSPYDIDVFYFKYGLDFDYMKDYGLNKDIDISNLGKFSNYKYRREFHGYFSSIRKFNYQYLRQSPPDNSFEHYIRFGKILNRSWISLGGCTQADDTAYYKGKFISTTFQKNLEIAACKSCLITTKWGDMEFLNFKDEENCLIFNTIREADRKISYYLENKEELQEIINKGYGLVHKNHNITDTTLELFKDIEKIYG